MLGRCAALIVAALVPTIVGCGSSGGSTDTSTSDGAKDPIVVGAAVAGDGLLEPYDQPALTAFKIAAHDVNAAGGIDGRQIKIVESDTRSDRARGPVAASEVLEKGADLVLASCDFDYGSPAARTAEQAGVLSFSLCAQSPKFGPAGVGPLAFTPAHSSLLEGATMAEWAYEKKGFRSAYVVMDSDQSNPSDVCNAFTDRFTELAGDGAIVGSEQIKNADPSIAASITRIKDANPRPDFIYFCTYPPGGPTHLRQMRAAGIDQPILSVMGMDGNYWLKATPDLTDFYYPANASVYGDDPSDRVNQVVADYTKQTGAPPVSGFGLFGAAILDLYKQAVEQARTTDSKAVAKALESMKGAETLVGATTYSPTTHIALDRPLRIMEVTGGKNRYVETWQVEKPPALPGS